MTKKDLIELLSRFPDEVHITLALDPAGTDSDIQNYGVSYGCDDLEKDSSKPENATSVAIYEKVPVALEGIYPDQVRLGLPLEFLELCDEQDITPKDVLHEFIADLCELQNYTTAPRADGLSSNGSDERMLANQYFERTWYRG